jgi:glutathione S-transferase
MSQLFSQGAIMLKLVGQWDSPFVRRVVITMRLYNIEFETLAYSAYDDMEKVRSINRLITTPSLILDSGEVLIDSSAIIDYLDELHGRAQALTPAEGEARRKVLNIIAITMVGCEKICNLYRETELRQPHLQLHAIIQRFRLQIAECYQLLENHLLGDWYVGDSMTQGDIAVAVLIGFADYFGEQLNCLPPKSFIKLRRLAVRCEGTPAFMQTPLE